MTQKDKTGRFVDDGKPNRNCRLTLRLTQDEWNGLGNIGKEFNLSIANVIRAMINSGGVECEISCNDARDFENGKELASHLNSEMEGYKATAYARGLEIQMLKDQETARKQTEHRAIMLEGLRSIEPPKRKSFLSRLFGG